MKVLLLSCGTGGGHDSAAKAIIEELNNLNIECNLIDSIHLTNQRVSNTVNNTYINMVNTHPNLFGKVYRIGELYSNLKIKSPVYGLNKLFAKNLEKYIIENKYDVIICTHLFPAETLTTIKKRNNNIHFLAVATDYVCIPFWEETNPDYFIIPSVDLKDDFIKKGIDEKKLLPFGIPTSPKNNLKVTKQEAREKLKLPADKKIILIMTGSMGYGKIDDTIDSIKETYPDCYIIIICGNNHQMKANLEDKYHHQSIISVGFTNEIYLYMRSCDALLTKPGGLTSTETAVLNVPTIFTKPIPGCENYNANFFAKREMAFCLNDPNNLLAYLEKIFTDQELVKHMQEQQTKYINKQATHDICTFIIDKFNNQIQKDND